MTKETEQLVLSEILETLQMLVNITMAANASHIKNVLEVELDTDQKRLVYDLLDGEKSVRDISTLSGVSISQISLLSQRWESLGLIVESKKSAIKGRRQKVFNLSNFGMSIGKLDS